MSLNDLTSDFVARINNAVRANLAEVEVLKNKLVVNICKKLTKLGYFNSFEVADRVINISINLDKTHSLKRISKPGLRVFSKAADKYRVSGGFGYVLLTTSTPEIVMTHKEAQSKNVGGEVLFQIV